MGQTLSQEIESREGKHEEVAVLRKREGEMLQKYEEKKAKLYIEALNDECLPIICAVDTFSDFLFNPKVSKQEDIGIIMEKHLNGKYLTEFLGLIKGVVEKVLAQPTDVVEEKYVHVVYANKSVLRIDYYLYRHRFKLQVGGVLTEVDTLLYFVQVGVIDMGRVRIPVLEYELTRATEPGELDEAHQEMKDRAQSSTHLQEVLQSLVAATKQITTIQNERQQGTT